MKVFLSSTGRDLKAYREALNHPDDGFLKTYWPGVKKACEYLIARYAATSGGKPDGTLSDDQVSGFCSRVLGLKMLSTKTDDI